MLGLDTGFFIRLLADHPAARGVWARITQGEAEAVISCLSLFELEKQGLKGAIEKPVAETLLEELPHLCLVVWLDEPDLLRRAARLAHGNGLAMADAIILASLIQAGSTEVYTTDSDLKVYKRGPGIVML